MFFLNLSIGEFLGLLTALSGIVAALYLLDRAKRKKLVSTLRFWTPALTADEEQSRKHMREPWSLLLQLAGLLLLLLAIAQLQWGTRERSGRDYVLLLDTSAWTAQRNSAGTLLDLEKRQAKQYLRALPSRDRVLLVRADGLATPVTTFTVDRVQLTAGINGSASEYSALNLEQALSFARQAQSWSGGRSGEIVYVGPKRVAELEGALPKLPQLRVISVEADPENCGVRHIGVKRNEEESNGWQAIVTVRNYGETRKTIRLSTRFAGTVFAPRQLNLGPGEETNAEYGFTTNTAGTLTAAIESADNFPDDDRASVQLPRSGALTVAVYTSRPEILKPLFQANHLLNVKYFAPSEYVPNPAADVMMLDQVSAGQPPKIASLWIAPPKANSPLPVKAELHDAAISSWNPDTELGVGLHAKEAHIASTEVFQSFEGDLNVASTAEGPVVVGRPASQGRAKFAVVGFDPLSGRLRYEVTTPLLFANLLRWLSPAAFRTLEVTAGQVGTFTLPLESSEQASHITLTDEKGFSVPFTLRNQTLQLFTGRPSMIRMKSNDRTRVLSLTLPDVAEFKWSPPATVPQGVPSSRQVNPTAVDLWQWLALFGGAILMLEWMLYGRRRTMKWRNPSTPISSVEAAARANFQRELVSK